MSHVIILSLSIGFVLVLMQSGCSELTSDEIDAKIRASEKLRRIDKVCNELPKPASFRFTKKGLSGNSDKSIIFYRYMSDESVSAVRTFFIQRASEAGYKVTGGNIREGFLSDVQLEREGITVVVENRSPTSIFSIACIE